LDLSDSKGLIVDLLGDWQSFEKIEYKGGEIFIMEKLEKGLIEFRAIS
jgi:hypothetical protein